MTTPKVPKFRRVRLEKFEQADGCALLRSLGGICYVLGTTRRQGDYQGTMQTPGISDVQCFLPPPRGRKDLQPRRLLVWEVKRTGGVASPEQLEYRNLCLQAGVWHVIGDLTTLMGVLVDAGYLSTSQLPADRQPHFRTRRDWETGT